MRRGQAVLVRGLAGVRGFHALADHLDGVRPPGEEHDGLGELAAAPDDVVGKDLPTELAVGVCGVLADGERGVEEKDALLGLVAEVPRRRLRAAEVGHQLLVDVA